MQRVAQAWLVLQLTDSPFALGLVSTLQFLPLLALSLVGGVLADRFPKRRVLIVTQTAMAVQSVLLAALTSSGRIQLWHIYLLAFGLGLANTFDNPTRQAFLMEMVGPEDLPNAVALNSSLFNSARVVGPALGGGVIAAAGVAACFWLNAISFIAVIGALVAMRPSEFFEQPQPRPGRVLSQLREGISYALRTREICLIVILLGALGCFGYNFNVFIPLLARYALNLDALGYGTLFSCLGAGSVLAALRLAARREATERALFSGAALFTAALLLIAVSPWFLLTAVLLAMLGAASIVFSSTANTRLQLVAPAALRGRIMSLYTLLFLGTTPIGSFVLGSLSERFGIQGALGICAGLCLLGLVAALLYARHQPSQPALEAPLTEPRLRGRPPL